MDKKNQLDVTFLFFISLLIVAQHVSGNHVPIIRSWRLRDVVALCWYVPWLQEGCQDRLAGSASMDGFVSQPYQPYQHKAITSRSRQLLMMGTWLPETCWATIRREIKNRKVTSSWFFLSTLLHSSYRVNTGVKRPESVVISSPYWGPSLNKEYSYTSILSLCLHSTLQSELNHLPFRKVVMFSEEKFKISESNCVLRYNIQNLTKG